MYKNKTWKHCGDNSSDKTKKNSYSCKAVHHHHNNNMLVVRRLQIKTGHRAVKRHTHKTIS